MQGKRHKSVTDGQARYTPDTEHWTTSCEESGSAAKSLLRKARLLDNRSVAPLLVDEDTCALYLTADVGLQQIQACGQVREGHCEIL